MANKLLTMIVPETIAKDIIDEYYDVAELFAVETVQKKEPFDMDEYTNHEKYNVAVDREPNDAYVFDRTNDKVGRKRHGLGRTPLEYGDD